MSEKNLTEIKIAEIDFSGRSREHLGDVDKLVASIERLGLLHPIVLLPDKTLVAGRRRPSPA